MDVPTQTPAQLRKFGLTVGGVLVGLFGLVGPLVRRRHLPIWPWPPGGLLIVAALAWPSSLRLVHRYWTLAGRALGWVNTRVLLTAIFFLLFTPVAIVLRLVGRDPLGRRRDPGAKSYRVLGERRTNLEAPY